MFDCPVEICLESKLFPIEFFFCIYFSRQNPFELIVALSSSGEADGGLFYDDGESLGKQKG